MNNIKANDGWFERGSEWRLWDLHLHTPCSFDYQDKSITNEEIISTLKDNKISAAVITDHFQIDVEKITNLIELGKSENILILPGIELTSELGGREAVHFIGIFDNKNVKNLWETLKIKLDLTEEQVESRGFKNLYLPIKETCEIIHEQGGIVSIHAGQKSNSVENVSNSFNFKQQLKKDLLSEHIDILEIKNKKEENDYQNIVFPNIGFALPLVICSDNHNIKEYTPKYCWIKSDLTFEGLKQIIYEPIERVKIQENKPDEKNSYEVIDSITFLDENFPKNEIKLNSNLVSIIGGKSTGKSTLLRSISNTVNFNSEKDSNWNKLINPSVKIKWCNGNENFFQYSNSEYENKDLNKAKIKYIPQNYLNKQVLDMEDENSFSNNLIKEILFENPQHKTIFDEIEKLGNDYKNNLNATIVNLFEIEKQINFENNSIKDIGSSDNITQEITKLSAEYTKLQKSNSITEDDLEHQNNLKKKLNKLEDDIETLKVEKEIFKEIVGDLENNPYSNLISLIEKLDEPISTNLFNEIEIAIFVSKQRIFDKIEEYLYENNQKSEKIKIEYEDVNKDLGELNQKLNTSEKKSTLFSRLNHEKEKLKNLNEKLELIKNLNSKYEKTLSDIFKLNSNYINNLKRLIEKFEFDDENSLFISECSFKINEFKENVKNMIDNRNFTTFHDKTKIDLNNLEYNKDFSKNLKIIIEYILKDILIVKSGYTKEDVLKKLLSPYHFLNFNILYENDTLEKMSPGKRSFVILKVLIMLDKSKWPILIDQPEDDLDANSISKDLTQFLKETKKERQIIIVSHNPNLVVGADSEQIIVANQEGNEVKNKFSKFEYISGSIENMYKNDDEDCYLYSKGIKEHVCDILEGGEESFRKRQKKYNIY
ncbi:MAG: hypothetical protein E7Z80_00820 [Methanobrevibacter thaueri]|nr:hypothetical protein [Methanobrevibacter thaueri]